MTTVDARSPSIAIGLTLDEIMLLLARLDPESNDPQLEMQRRNLRKRLLDLGMAMKLRVS